MFSAVLQKIGLVQKEQPQDNKLDDELNKFEGEVKEQVKDIQGNTDKKEDEGEWVEEDSEDSDEVDKKDNIDSDDIDGDDSVDSEEVDDIDSDDSDEESEEEVQKVKSKKKGKKSKVAESDEQSEESEEEQKPKKKGKKSKKEEWSEDDEESDEEVEEEKPQKRSKRGRKEKESILQKIESKEPDLFDQYCNQWLDIEKAKKGEFIVEKEISEETVEKIIETDYFMLLLKSVLFWKKMRFQKVNVPLTIQKRQILGTSEEVIEGESDDDKKTRLTKIMSEYRKVCNSLDELEESLMQSTLNDVLAKVGIAEEIFTKSLNFYQQDEALQKEMKAISQLTQKSMLDIYKHYQQNGKLEAMVLSEEEAFQILAVKYAIEFNLEQDLKTIDKEQQMKEAKALMPHLTQDHLFLQVGIDWQQVEVNINQILEQKKDTPPFLKLKERVYAAQLKKLQK